MIRLFLILWTMASGQAFADACFGHGGPVRCGPSGQTVCEDGTLDKRAPCTPGKRLGEKPGRKVKFKKHSDRGQILKPGESAPTTTLSESHRSLKKN